MTARRTAPRRTAPHRVDSLDALDQALVDIRRFWAHPGMVRRFAAELGVVVELSVLRTLRAVESGDVCVTDVAEALDVRASTASRLVNQAVQGGYVQQAPSPHDGRRTILRLTPEGADLLRRANETRWSLLDKVTADWAAEDVEELARLLRRLRRGLEDLGR